MDEVDVNKCGIGGLCGILLTESVWKNPALSITGVWAFLFNINVIVSVAIFETWHKNKIIQLKNHEDC